MLKRTASPSGSAQPRTSGHGVAHLDFALASRPRLRTGTPTFSTTPPPQLDSSGGVGGSSWQGAAGSEGSAASWPAFVESYAAGQWRADATPPVPAAVANLLGHRLGRQDHPSPLRASSAAPSPPQSTGLLSESIDDPMCGDTSSPSYLACGVIPATEIPAGGLLQVRPPGPSLGGCIPADHVAPSKFYEANGFFPAPKGPWNAERLQLMRRYGLEQPARREALDRVIRIAKAHWQTKTVIITMVFDQEQIFAAETGWSCVDPLPDTPLSSMALMSAVCPHGMTQLDPKVTFIIPNASQDWRFAKNPLTLSGALSFYASANIHLPTSAILRTSPPTVGNLPLPSTLPVGSICIIDDKPRGSAEDFTIADRALLHDLADAVAREFQLGFEAIRRSTETKQADYLATFLSSALLSPSPDEPAPPTHSLAPPAESPRGSRRAPSTDATEASESSECGTTHCYEDTARQIRALTLANSAAILDLRSLRAAVAPSGEVRADEMDWGGRWGEAFDETPFGEDSVYLMGSDGDDNWDRILRQEGANAIIAASLSSYSTTGTLNSAAAENPLSQLLPHDTSASLCVPLNDVDGSPALLLILTSKDPHFQFEDADRRFVRQVGAVIMATLLRQKAHEADRAKLAFVSQVSHELRTPLHGINSQLELIREFSSPKQLSKIRPLLDVADVCLESLRDVLDDTLELGKLSSQAPSEIQKSLVQADLAQLVEDVIKATWVRKKRVEIVSNDVHSDPSTFTEKVDMVLEVQELVLWTTLLDVGGMKRVLLNLIGNSLKFTSEGSVRVRLQELVATADSIPVPAGQRLVSIDVIDTGCGMGAAFLRDGKHLLPFIQENQFASGAGLGMSSKLHHQRYLFIANSVPFPVCDRIIKRLGGKMEVHSAPGQGTTVRVTLPLASAERSPFHPSNPSSSRSNPVPTEPTFRRRVLSDELGTILKTPGSEKDEFDFNVDTLNTLKTGSRMGPAPPPLRGSLPLPTSVVAECLEAPDFALEIKRLSVMTTAALVLPGGSYSSTFPIPVEHDLDSHTSPMETWSQKTPTAANPRSLPDVGWTGDAPTAFLAPGVNILCADDNPIARTILAKLLHGKGIAFEMAVDGADAVEKYKLQTFSLLLLDVQMPKVDGIQAANEIRTYERAMGLPRVRIVALSGLSNEIDKAAALEGRNGEPGPVDCFITKGGKSLRLILDEIAAFQTASGPAP